MKSLTIQGCLEHNTLCKLPFLLAPWSGKWMICWTTHRAKLKRVLQLFRQVNIDAKLSVVAVARKDFHVLQFKVQTGSMHVVKTAFENPKEDIGGTSDLVFFVAPHALPERDLHNFIKERPMWHGE